MLEFSYFELGVLFKGLVSRQGGCLVTFLNISKLASRGFAARGGDAAKSHSTSTQYPRGGGDWVFFGWVCAARDSKLSPRSKKDFP